MISTILYFASLAASFIGILFIPRADDKTDWVQWLGPSFFLIIAADGLVAGVLTLCGIPVNITIIIITHTFIMSLSVLLCWRKRCHQSIAISRSNAIAFALILVTALLCLRAEFGSDFTPHYRSTDAAVHLIYSVSEASYDMVSGQYLAWNYIATWIDALSPLASLLGWRMMDLYYRALLICDGTFFLMGSLLFYSCVKRFVSHGTSSSLFVVVATLAYMLSYPLANLIYGFVYLGVGVSLSLLAAYFTYSYLNDNTILNYVGSCLGLFGITVSYPLFAPPIYLACFSLILWSWKQQGRIFSLAHIASCAIGLLIPGLIGVRFFFSGTLGGGNLSAATQISLEGLIYRNLYSNFVFLIPLIIVAIFVIIKEKHKRVVPITVFLIFVFTYFIFAFVLVLLDLVSTYYFFKLHFLLAPFAFIAATIGAHFVRSGHGNALLAAYSGTVLLITGIAVCGIDNRLNEHFENYSIGIPESAHPYVHIYTSNLNDLLSTPGLDEDMFDLFEAAEELYRSIDEDEAIPVLGSDVYNLWFRALVPEAQNVVPYTPWWFTSDPIELAQRIRNECPYVIVITTDKFWGGGSSESDTAVAELEGELDVVFENEAGYIAHVNTSSHTS